MSLTTARKRIKRVMKTTHSAVSHNGLIMFHDPVDCCINHVSQSEHDLCILSDQPHLRLQAQKALVWLPNKLSTI